MGGKARRLTLFEARPFSSRGRFSRPKDDDGCIKKACCYHHIIIIIIEGASHHDDIVIEHNRYGKHEEDQSIIKCAACNSH
jgi:hypothetical protein